MFAYKEKITLTIINVKDRNGKIIPINVSLPYNIKKIDFPENIAQLSIIEYHEGIETYGHRAFNIYVGQTSTIHEMLDKKLKIRINSNLKSEIKSIDEQLVYYQKEEGILNIFALVQGNDIVVNNVEELEAVLKTISREFESIKRSVAKIRKLGKNNK